MNFSLGLKLMRFFCFWKCQFERDQRSNFNNDTYSKNVFALVVSGYVSALRKKVIFSGTSYFF